MRARLRGRLKSRVGSRERLCAARNPCVVARGPLRLRACRHFPAASAPRARVARDPGAVLGRGSIRAAEPAVDCEPSQAGAGSGSTEPAESGQPVCGAGGFAAVKEGQGSALIPNDPEAEPSRDLDLHVAIGSKAFFSEEKKQKTFANSGICSIRTVRDSN